MSRFGGIFDYESKLLRLEEVQRELENPELWQNPDKAQAFGKERAALALIVEQCDRIRRALIDAQEFLDMAVIEQDASILTEVEHELSKIQNEVAELEFQRMFAGEMDPNNAYLKIQAGSGGTEAQDWAEMLLRMYLRWCETHGFKTSITDIMAGDVAGIKSVTVEVEGSYAYGWLRTETGVHRLVRKSPFDSGNARHTSFASVFVTPEISDDIEVDVNPADLRIDTYRASGAGGQHVNKTDSAIRITHEPTGIVVQCQSDRSQHKNRAQAFKQLRAKLYELELQKKNAARTALESNKSEISWGSQIRSYVLDDARIKDLRTGVETRNTQGVLDGDLDLFIKASLQAGV